MLFCGRTYNLCYPGTLQFSIQRIAGELDAAARCRSRPPLWSTESCRFAASYRETIRIDRYAGSMVPCAPSKTELSELTHAVARLLIRRTKRSR
eukprot:scaffold3719_cov247-Pinguiococcus_pyrenoidosus.AAC.25